MKFGRAPDTQTIRIFVVLTSISHEVRTTLSLVSQSVKLITQVTFLTLGSLRTLTRVTEDLIDDSNEREKRPNVESSVQRTLSNADTIDTSGSLAGVECLRTILCSLYLQEPLR
jgi:hypothetical protein